jgi:hypothetical protein
MRVKLMWVRSSADTIKFIFRKAVRSFELLAIAWRLFLDCRAEQT